MKKILFPIIFYFLSTLTIYAQKSNEIRVHYGIDDSFLSRMGGELLGAGTKDVNNSQNIGITYLRELSRNLCLETGINYFNSTVELTPSFNGYNDVTSSYENFNLTSVSLYVNYTFLKYFFVNSGAMLSIQNTKNSFHEQSGFGLGLGVGAKYYFKNFLIYINPNIKQHTLIPFKKESEQQRLTSLETQIGIGYRF